MVRRCHPHCRETLVVVIKSFDSGLPVYQCGQKTPCKALSILEIVRRNHKLKAFW